LNSILEVISLRKNFGGVVALDDLSFKVHEGAIKSIIGPNGAGKTTLFNIITGIYGASSGRVRFGGRDIAGLPAHVVARRGISRTFQNLQLFSNMTVLENVLVGRHCRTRVGFLRAAFRLPGSLKEEKRSVEAAVEILRFVGLEDSMHRGAGTLPFGKQRAVEIARALATQPALLLLDEPASGLNVRETEEVGRLIRRIRNRGKTVVVVEHDMSLVMGISEEVVVLDHGRIIAEGPPREVQKHPEVLRVYLGEDVSHAAGAES
jgi:ABC-type branched-subunit amino acid transport system ATPase component